MGALISVTELRKLTDAVLVDVQWSLGGPPGREDYERAHLPGAHFVDLDGELAASPGAGGRHPMPAPQTVQGTLRRCGVDADSTVVVYDGRTSLAAARAWWVFRYFGLADVRVLDGGMAAWRAAGGAVTAAEPAAGAGTFTAAPGHLPVLDAEGAALVARDGILLDARAPERYAGESEPMDPVAGHIPGAVNAPMSDYLQEDGRFAPPARLQEYFTAKGVDRDVTVGTSCGSGVTAAHEALALSEIGVRPAVYVGSWSDWVTDPGRPVATGAEPG